jgi:membrane-associated protein
MVCGAVLHSTWLLPVLALMIAVDGPAPMMPSETLLLAGLALAVGDRDVPMLASLFVVSVLGSVSGDLAVFGLGRGSRWMGVRAVETEARLPGWVRRNVLCRPGVTLVGARFLPAGRLVSTAAAGRYGLPLGTFVPWSVVSSAAWALYMTLVATLIHPIADGSPLSALLAGTAIAVLTAAGFAAANAVRDRRVLQPAAVPGGRPLHLSGK